MAELPSLEMGPFDITLHDDGTMDTVVSFTCPDLLMIN